MRFTTADLELFSAASHDRNPLHVCAQYARATAVGEPVVFGILSTLAALAGSAQEPGKSLARLSLNFRNPLLCGVDYELKSSTGKAGARRFSVEDGGRVMLSGNFETRDASTANARVYCAATDPHTSARTWAADELQPGLLICGEYGPEPSAFERLLDTWCSGSGLVSTQQAAVLLWCSYLVGMHLPGETAIFSAARIEFAAQALAEDAPLRYEATVSAFDDRFGFLSVTAVLRRGDAVCATVELSAFSRHDSPRLSLSGLAEKLPPSHVLEGKTAVVTGGSRGLGAALVTALASQGCHVFLNYQASELHAKQVAARAADMSGRISLLQADASRSDWSEKLQSSLAEAGSSLDFLVCCSSPSIGRIGFAPQSSGRFRAFVDNSISQIYNPLAGLHHLLELSAGVTVLISSQVAAPSVTNYPADWLHYVTAKYAAEGLVHSVAARSKRGRFLIVRPPRLLTDQTNTTQGRQGALRVEGVAATIVSRLCDAALDERLAVIDL